MGTVKLGCQQLKQTNGSPIYKDDGFQVAQKVMLRCKRNLQEQRHHNVTAEAHDDRAPSWKVQ